MWAGSVTRIAVPPSTATTSRVPWSWRARSSIVSSERMRRSGSASSATVATSPPSAVGDTVTVTWLGGPRRIDWSISSRMIV